MYGFFLLKFTDVPRGKITVHVTLTPYTAFVSDADDRFRVPDKKNPFLFEMIFENPVTLSETSITHETSKLPKFEYIKNK